jgi:hypothetical protein
MGRQQERLNGAFGSGKSSLASAVCAAWPRARTFDPEEVGLGFMLHEISHASRSASTAPSAAEILPTGHQALFDRLLGAAALRFGRLLGLGELIDTVIDGRSFRSKLASSRRCAARVKGGAARRYGRPQW